MCHVHEHYIGIKDHSAEFARKPHVAATTRLVEGGRFTAVPLEPLNRFRAGATVAAPMGCKEDDDANGRFLSREA